MLISKIMTNIVFLSLLAFGLAASTSAVAGNATRVNPNLAVRGVHCTPMLGTGWVCSDSKRARSKAIAVWSRRFGSWYRARNRSVRCRTGSPSRRCSVASASFCKHVALRSHANAAHRCILVFFPAEKRCPSFTFRRGSAFFWKPVDITAVFSRSTSRWFQSLRSCGYLRLVQLPEVVQ